MHFAHLSLRWWIQKSLQAIALVLALGTPHLHAATALLLSTDEFGNSDTNAYVTRAMDSLAAALGATRVTDKRGALSDMPSVPLSDADFQGQNLVLVITGYEPIDASRWAIVKNQLLTNPNSIFLFFVDGCCSQATNIEEVTQALDDATGLGLTTHPYLPEAYGYSRLNTNSPYSGEFMSQPEIYGLHASLISNVPAEYALYLPPDAVTLTPAVGTRVDTLGFLVPKAINRGGQGACAFVLADSNPMNSSAEQMVGNFLRAALNPTGACQLNFSYVDLSVSTAANWTLVPNTQLNVPLEVRNLGAEETQGGELRIDLPAGVHTVPGGLPSGCSLVWGDSDRGPQGISCDLPALPGQSSHIFQIPVMGEEAGEFTVGLEVMPLEMDGNLSNNVSSTQMKMVGTTVVTHAVPVNGGIFLWGLSCLMGLAWVRRRKMH